MNKKVLLMILDGWGIGKQDQSNAIFEAGTPCIDQLMEQYPNAQLIACGEDVGLPDGQMGNSEVGHLNIGAGHVVYQDLVKINKACHENSIMQNEEVIRAFTYAKENNKQVHLMGLASDGGVHSSLNHLYKLCDIAKEYGITHTFIHCFMDGRDTDPKSGKRFIGQIEKHLAHSAGKIATVVGRYYAMDRDNRWDRVKEAYDLLVSGKGDPVSNIQEAIQSSYNEGITDEFIKPLVHVDAEGKPVGLIQEGDMVIFFNYRNDRARELTCVLTQKDMPEEEMKVIPALYYCCMTPYDASFKNVHILFDKENIRNTLGEVISKAGKTQLRIAETEKYAHVTFFFSGGREEAFEHERRCLIASPKVATYDLLPEMSAVEVKDALIAEIKKNDLDFIALNFANGDMVGHTGVFLAIEQAVKTVDTCVGEVIKVAREYGFSVMIIADHGNADCAVNLDGTPNTAHSLNPVPIIIVDNEIHKVQNGRLADVAPTILKMMGIPIPKEMTGNVLVS